MIYLAGYQDSDLQHFAGWLTTGGYPHHRSYEGRFLAKRLGLLTAGSPYLPGAASSVVVRFDVNQ